MKPNPVFHAILASLYIILVSAVMNWGSSLAPKEDTILAPIAALSLFTLSAAVMAYLFGYEPFRLFFEKKHNQAVSFFLQTVAIFGILTTLAMALLFSGWL